MSFQLQCNFSSECANGPKLLFKVLQHTSQQDYIEEMLCSLDIRHIAY